MCSPPRGDDMGKPKRDRSERRDVLLTMNTSASFAEETRLLAHREGQSVSGLLRWLVAQRLRAEAAAADDRRAAS